MTKNAPGRMKVLCAAALALMLGGCSTAQAPVVVSAPPLPTAITAPAQTLPTVAQEELISLEMFNDFALRVFISQRKEANWAVSPVNAALALEQLRPGALEETAEEMDGVLGLEGQYGEDQVWASLVNLRSQLESLAPGSLWQSWGLMMGEGPSVQVQYTNLLQQSLGSGVQLVDYEAEGGHDLMTSWIKQASGGLITKLTSVPEVNKPMTVISAAALDGKWAKAFNPENIRNAPFALENGQKVSASMMTSKVSPAVLKNEEVTFAAVAMENQLEAWLILPPEGKKLDDFVSTLTLEKLTGWRSEAQAEACLLSVPKVDITSDYELSGALMAMGLSSASDPEKADFGAMGSNISIGSVLTASRIRLSESGVAACDEAMSQRMLRGMDRELKSYNFDRPYVLIVADKRTGGLVMLAGVSRPAASES